MLGLVEIECQMGLSLVMGFMPDQDLQCLADGDVALGEGRGDGFQIEIGRAHV